MAALLRRTLLAALLFPAWVSGQETVTTIEIDRIQLGVYLSPETEQMLGRESRTLLRSVETALSARGMGAAVRGLPGRFVAYIDLVPLEERMMGGMVAVREQLSITFGDEQGGRSMGAFVTERAATGRTKEVALRNFATSLNLRTDKRWNEALDDANRAIIASFEQECPAILREADAKSQQKLFDEAIYLVTTVPRQAKGCHEQATAKAQDIYTASLKAQCVGPFAQGKASWAANKSRDNAMKVADVIGSIPADSPCFTEASNLMDGVAAVIAKYDEADAKERLEEIAFERKKYEDEMALVRQQMADELQLEQGRINRDTIVGKANANAVKAMGVAYAKALAQRQPQPESKIIVLK
ncbi:MAG: hypothetical protein RLZZ63_589 [Gemmatimonadota bacterium]|jgi:hypothetical protein